MMDKRKSKIDTGLIIKKKDIRPIKDKDYQAQCLKNIIKFLIINEYPQPISLQMCQASNTMIFRDIIDFLLHIIDPFFVYSNDKELQELLKFLGYPYELHSHFFSGALHY